jgi:hypothetical protein
MSILLGILAVLLFIGIIIVLCIVASVLEDNSFKKGL